MAILKQVVDLQETVKRLMEQNAKLRGERDAMKDHIERYGDLCNLCKHHYTWCGSDCVTCVRNGKECVCASCWQSDDAKNYEWNGGATT